jgi:V8-like Glu-specific endopeptidase
MRRVLVLAATAALAVGCGSGGRHADSAGSPESQRIAPLVESSKPQTRPKKSRAAHIPMTPSVPLTGTAFAGTPTVGALFSMSGGQLIRHFCTASVIDSPAKDLIITAAHCVSGLRHIGFVPGYRDGRKPYGVWVVTRVITDPEWSSSADPDHDVAFLVVDRPGTTTKIQNVTGAAKLGVGRSPTGVVRVIGYPIGKGRPISCQNRTRAHGRRQLEFDCGNYVGGTSGGPFLTDVDRSNSAGTVVGVIGGHERGGIYSDVSYSIIFGDDVKALYKTATSHS